MKLAPRASTSSNVSCLVPIAQYYPSSVTSWVEGMRGAGVYVEYVDAYVAVVGWVNLRAWFHIDIVYF